MKHLNKAKLELFKQELVELIGRMYDVCPDDPVAFVIYLTDGCTLPGGMMQVDQISNITDEQMLLDLVNDANTTLMSVDMLARGN